MNAMIIALAISALSCRTESVPLQAPSEVDRLTPSAFNWSEYQPIRGYVIRRLPTPPQYIVAAGDSVRRPDVYQGVVEKVPSPVTVQLCDSTGEWRYEYTLVPPLAVGDTVWFELRDASLYYGKYYIHLPVNSTGMILKKRLFP